MDVGIPDETIAAVTLTGLSRQASAWAALTLIVLLVVHHVLLPRLTLAQRRTFDIAFVPLLAMFVIFALADFLGATP